MEHTRIGIRISRAAGLIGLVLAAGLVVTTAAPAQAQEAEGSRWEKAIAAFEQSDRENPPAMGSIVFVGSSSIRMWDLKKWFPGLPVINRGFGGSQTSDSVQFADRIVIPYKPRAVFLYAGDNDIAAGESATQVAEDFDAFVDKIHAELPKTTIHYVCIKPSLARWSLVDEMREANALIKRRTESDNRLFFIDIDGPGSGKDGKPREDIFLDDGLHLNATGYEIWTSIVMPYVKSALKE